MLRRMARLLYALSLLLEDGILTAAMGQMQPGALDANAPHCLAGLLHAALKDMADGYADKAHAAIPSSSLHAFLKVRVHGALQSRSSTLGNVPLQHDACTVKATCQLLANLHFA